MPRIIKDQPKKKTKPKVTKKVKNPKEYYQCMNACCKGKNITQVAHDCKSNALAINAKVSARKAQAVKQIKEGYESLGKALAEFIKVS
jgi:anthranilate phosphoribosyltransferase